MKEHILDLLNDPELKPVLEETPERLAQRIEAYLRYWKKWNAKINLTSEKEASGVLDKHVFDSLHFARPVPGHGWVMDIGSGAGFPGLIVKLARPRLHLVLVESRRKRANFLRTAIRGLDLEEIEVVEERAEALGDPWMGKFDAVLFRAVGSLDRCFRLAAPLLRGGGTLVVQKEPGAAESEGAAAGKFHFQKKEEISLEGRTGRRSSLLVFEKCFT